MSKIKRILSFLLCAMMVISMIPAVSLGAWIVKTIVKKIREKTKKQQKQTVTV